MDKIGTEVGFCAQTASFWQLLGYFLLVFKIVLPIILIVIGIITLGKAVITDDEKVAKGCFNSMIKKFIIAVVIFFLPTIISACFKFVKDFSELQDDYRVCEKCITHPRGSFCTDKVEDLELGNYDE